MAYIGKQPTPVPLTAADFADDTITEAKMANDAISLAELKAGTDGEIISWDASGNPVAVGVGSDGQVLTSTGAGSPPAFEAAAGGNTPYFYATRIAGHQSFGDNSWTKAQLSNEVADSGTVYDPSSNYRFTPGVVGKYYIFFYCTLSSSADGAGGFDFDHSRVAIYKNGANIAEAQARHHGDDADEDPYTLTIIDVADADDYYEAYVYADSSDASSSALRGDSDEYNGFGGFKIA